MTKKVKIKGEEYDLSDAEAALIITLQELIQQLRRK